MVSDRFFLPEGKTADHRLLWLGADCLMLTLLVFGLVALFVTGFSVAVSRIFYPALLLLCVGSTLLCRSDWVRRHAALWAIGILFLYLLALFACQDAFLQGGRQFLGLVSDTIRRTYSSGETEAPPVSSGSADTFVLLCAVPVTLWLAAALLGKHSLLLANLLVFPLLAMLALCGGATHTAALFTLFLGILLSTAATRPQRQYRMWGGKNGKLRQENGRRFQSIQKKSMALLLAGALTLAAPAYWVVRPLMEGPLKPARQASLELQSGLLTKLRRLLPDISAGEWNLQLEAVGGGVQDGAVGSEEGYLIEDVEDLRLTLNTRPKETLFLKGYIGTVYRDGSWDNPSGSSFDGAAMNWNTEGSPRLYVQNLPFLRTAYASGAGEISAEPAQLLVERRNASNAYTYVPYGAYLNDYYQISSGDGAVAGQSEQEDRYYFFFREDTESVLTAWNALEDTANVLDRVEEAYRAFCQTHYREEWAGMESLQETVDAVLAENRWTPEKNREEISAWIRQYLAEGYQFEKNPKPIPEGSDPVQYFLFTSRCGSSVHFASAAVLLYRMFGIPARYVVGYEVPAVLFSAQAGGIYTAVVQGDNAQAWAEIYVPGLGWQPKDMTPGVIGTFAEVGPGGERIEGAVEGSAAAEETTEAPPEPAETPGKAIRDVSLEQLVMYLAYAALAVGLAFFGRFVCRAMGYDPFHRRTRQQRLLGVFQALYARAVRLGLPKEADSQSEVFLSFCETELARRDGEAAHLFRPAVEKLYRSSFGGWPMSREDIRTMRRLLIALWKRPSTG